MKQTIDGLSALCEPQPDEDFVEVQEGGEPYSFKLTDAIRLVFSGSSEPVLTAPEIRDELVAKGIKLSKYKQPLVPIHNTLKRLALQGELVEFRDDAGDLRGYRWVSPLARAVAEVSPIPAGHPAQHLRMRKINPGASQRIGVWMEQNDPRKIK
ncbi:MAG TPA: hypothetical protein VNY51_05810 [Candidatus Dormibacteraeota bacterium]|nr:hypothetical protein [Candidatus Dormibacteraeota bacterium]